MILFNYQSFADGFDCFDSHSGWSYNKFTIKKQENQVQIMFSKHTVDSVLNALNGYHDRGKPYIQISLPKKNCLTNFSEHVVKCEANNISVAFNNIGSTKPDQVFKIKHLNLDVINRNIRYIQSNTFSQGHRRDYSFSEKESNYKSITLTITTGSRSHTLSQQFSNHRCDSLGTPDVT